MVFRLYWEDANNRMKKVCYWCSKRPPKKRVVLMAQTFGGSPEKRIFCSFECFVVWAKESLGLVEEV